ncbi:hypothetical protein WJX74_009510 [Apatococcus lobatus]|uniref:RNA polymerase sigma-70 domain-containing protein n=1 Tax=Apatococcus lobatus TaxID=904363 RepID=A0AAW1QBQ2_9CHLO
MILCWHTSPSAWGLRAHDRSNPPGAPGASSQPVTSQPQVACRSAATERQAAREAAAQRAEQPEPGSEPLRPLEPDDFPRAPRNFGGPESSAGSDFKSQLERFLVKNLSLPGEVLLHDVLLGYQSESLLNEQAEQLPRIAATASATADPAQASSSSLRSLFSDVSDRDQIFSGSSTRLSQDGRRAGRRHHNGNARLERLQSSAAAAALAGVEPSAIEAAWQRNDPAQHPSTSAASPQQHFLERRPRVINAFDSTATQQISFACLLAEESMQPIKSRSEEARLVAIMQEGRRLEHILQQRQGGAADMTSSQAAVERHTGLSYSVARRRIRAGHSAHEHLLRSNYMLVMKLVRDAQRIGRHAVAEEDLCQAGLVGLRSALEKFDGSKGAKVSTFAYQAIRNSLYRTFMDSSRLVRIPQSTLDRVKEVQKVVNAFLDKHGREPSIPELQRLTGLTAAMLQRSEAARKLQETQLDALTDSSSGSGQSMDKVEMIADTSETPDQDTYRRTATALILEALKELPEREAYVLASVYGLRDGIPKTQREVSVALQVGAALNVSTTRIHQLEKAALQRLKANDAIAGLEDFQSLAFGAH